MALTPKLFSADTVHTAAWDGTERVTGLVDIGGGTWRNRLFALTQMHRFITTAFGSLPAAAAGNAGQFRRVTGLATGEGVVMSTGAEWILVGNRVYDLGLFIPGVPDAITNPTLQKIVVIRPTLIPANFSGAAGHVDTPPDNTYDIDVQDDGVSIGTISISDAGAFTFTTDGGTAKEVDAGSRLEFIGPSTTEPSMLNMSVTIPVLLRAVSA